MKDPFLEDRIEKYDKLIRENKIPGASRVVPVKKSIEGKICVFPYHKASEILQAADKIALTHCLCREHYNRCDAPKDVCLLMDKAAAKSVSQGKGQYISIVDAVKVLKKADEYGLVHLAFHSPGETFFAFCSCCGCCCHDLNILKKYNRPDLIGGSEYIAATNMDECTECMACTDFCHFNARINVEGKLVFNQDDCFGCGVCAPACPSDAIQMKEACKRKPF